MSNSLETNLGSLLPERTAFFNHPDDVVRDETLSLEEKRQVLASWASDAHAVAGAPALRQLDSGSVVELDAILEALLSLDGRRTAVELQSDRVKRFLPNAGRQQAILRWRKRARRVPHWDDDDDPPPCPASNALPLPSHFVPAYGRLAA